MNNFIFKEKPAGKPNEQEANMEQWKVMIVDDEKDIHTVTRFALVDYSFLGKKLKFISAYSGAEATKLIKEHSNTAVILLDVVMEKQDSGLQFVETVRNDIGNKFSRIILRTGHPGFAPEEEVIIKYDINDYTNKTDLTDRMLISSITTALRSYSDIMTIESYRQNLEQKVKERTTKINELMGIAAHDLRNPLISIRGFSEMLHEEDMGPLNEKQKVYTKMINSTSTQMLSLVNDLLDVSVIESGKLELRLINRQIKEIIENRVQIYKISSDIKKITIQTDYADVPNAKFDPDRIAQVIDNLISNAIKFSEPGSKIDISLGYEENMVRICVRDRGPGIPESEISSLFGKFKKLSARPTGGEKSTGLGLAIVKKIMDAHKGFIEVKSEIGAGSVFIIKIPVETTKAKK